MKKGWPLQAYLALTIGSVLLLGTAAAAEIPELIPSSYPGQQEPSWVSASAATNDDGSKRWDLFTPSARGHIKILVETYSATRQRYEEMLAAGLEPDSEPCGWGGPATDDPFGDLSLEAGAAFAEAIYAGTVVSSSQGLLEGHPGTLFEVEVDEVLKAPDLTPRPATLLLYYPYARFSLGGDWICGLGDRFPAVPAIGGQILIMSKFAVSHDEQILNTGDGGLYFEDAENLFSVPRRYRELSTLGFDFFAQKMRTAAKSAQKMNTNEAEDACD